MEPKVFASYRAMQSTHSGGQQGCFGELDTIDQPVVMLVRQTAEHHLFWTSWTLLRLFQMNWWISIC